ncbi:NleD-like pathogen effector protein (putative zinc metallopeptidase) [Comamonas sp. BIGb0124]|uniref:M91 family zinc metallopeptidase n=1 Tax=Comamonas sp. BIGb0124 TaxID=2485130 RepID=UPI000F46FEF7|nr:M91 family zinc metallopeptidase [Comamonas sp. BIGb0124]ROR25112.1 NleD-like pathogen effector protein (putative zinc metallopeptidase) [Comamonas sp. BIGb0124]
MYKLHRTTHGVVIAYQSSAVVANVFIELHNKARPAFFQEVEAMLGQIQSRPAGTLLLQSIRKYQGNGNSVYVSFTSKDSEAAPCLNDTQLEMYGLTDESSDYESQALARIISTRQGGGRGVGTSAEIFLNPVDGISVDADGYPSAISNTKTAFVTLGHELLHASRYLKGSANFPTEEVYGFSYEEEMRAVGLGVWEDKAYSENKLRAEHGLPLRKHYYPKEAKAYSSDDPAKKAEAAVATSPPAPVGEAFDQVGHPHCNGSDKSFAAKPETLIDPAPPRWVGDPAGPDGLTPAPRWTGLSPLDDTHADGGLIGTKSHAPLTPKREERGSSGDWNKVASELDTDRVAMPLQVRQPVPARNGEIQGWDAGSFLQGSREVLPHLSGMKGPGDSPPLPPEENLGSMEWADPHSRYTSGIFGEGV